MAKKILVCIIGPTGIGKTRLAIALAQHYDTEILSADSRQFYKEMTIGTAVPTTDELSAAPHHFIQHKSIFEAYTVGDFERDALAKLTELYKKKDFVIMAGGSALYVDAVVKGLDDFPEIDPKIRKALVTALNEKGLAHLQEELKERDPKYYRSVDLQNPQRLIRALEVCMATGQPYSSFRNQKKVVRPFKSFYVGLRADRETIYDRINQRVDQMMADGLLKEAKSLYAHRELNALQTVGYKELFDYLDGTATLAEAVAEIKKNTRRFAKRQLTWYRKKPSILWVDYDMSTDEIVAKLNHKIATES
ncbi:tRNA (adenosine(37)-N6)-dimethylallyltransferase MiaA [Flagellimonas lutaonensis]|uniref:tRNA dimethylallyltransferase n=1 Tax=Flagellimonas lutaonensis TaxID=516051 RepID=A0A0D5YXJ9_9FLAO|nr:tRNA (adenosine(37)-N6)-dimethylallyltransferase MiaA [Allomuricauda lutaonensis]AKA36568.1 tRNA dimethylallyltransferase [Allomuricauda lutaonensis]